MNEKTGERKYGAMAFLPLLVFLALLGFYLHLWELMEHLKSSQDM